MVVVNDFEFQIVTAEDKTPFKEHKKGANTYVEVEPDAEYFLSLRRVRDLSTALTVTYEVDGKSLGYKKTFQKGLSADGHRYCFGIYSWSNGVVSKKALKFIKADFATEATEVCSTMTGMGKIELKVCRAVYLGYYEEKGDWSNGSFTASTIKFDDNAPTTMKKNLRSGEGHIIETRNYDTKRKKKHHRPGDHLYTITLHYCATPGLIAVGILPKPPLWEYGRMLKPSKMTAEEKAKIEKAVISVKRNRKGNEILELGDSDDDSDSDEDDGTEKNENTNDRTQVRRSNRKKART